MKIRTILICGWLLAASAAQAQDAVGEYTEFINQTVGGRTEVVGGHGEEKAIGNTLIVSGSTIQKNNSPLHNAVVIGGRANTQAANENRVEVTGSTIDRSIYGGYTSYGVEANNNIVSISGSSISPNSPLHQDTTLTDYQVIHRVDEQTQEDIYELSSVTVDSAQIAGEMPSDPLLEESNYNIYGGAVGQGEAAYNRVEITDSGTDTPIGNNVIGGYSPYLSETYLHDNTVEITGSRISGLVAGAAGLGASWDITVRQPLRNDNNSVILRNSQANDVIGAYGGISTDGNSVLLSGSEANNVYGVSFGQNIFYSNGQPQEIENTARNNIVTLQDNSTATGNVYGAQSHSVQASGNRALITDSKAQGNIFGAHISNALVQQDQNTVGWNTVQALAQNNGVILQNAEAGGSSSAIAGALNFSGAANNNTVQITASTVTASALAGGWAEHERQTLTDRGQQEFAIGFQADGNGVTAHNSTLTADTYGGLVTRKDAKNPDTAEDNTLSSASSNYVELYTSAVTGSVYGGAARGNYTQANGNRVWLSDTNVSGSVYGGLAEGTDSVSSNNEVILHNTAVGGDVYGSSAAQGSGNTVTLSGKTTVSGTVYGGAGTDNQLTLLDFQSSEALKLANFDRPYLIVGADTSVTFSQDVKEAHVVIQGIEDVDGHVLARTPDANSSFILHSEDSGVYTYSLTPQAEAGGLTAWLLSGGFSQQRAHGYAQTGLIALALANAGDSLLDGVINQAAQSGQETGAFLKTGYEHLKHDTGSGFTLRATTALAGLYGQHDALTGGLYARYAYGSYTAYPVRADSYAASWAGGAFGAWDATENLRLLADARVGWQTTSYGGSSETGASFDYEGAFTSMQAGAVYALDDQLTAGAKLRWTHIQGDSMRDNLGESIYISGSDSLLGTLGLTYTPQGLSLGYFTPLAKAELLHEFNGRGVSRVEGHRLDALSLRGTSARGTLGLAYHNSAQGVSAMLAAFAQGGQADGWGAKLNAALRF